MWAAVTAILAFCCTLISVWVTNRSNDKRLHIQFEHERKVKKEEMLRTRLEELYVESNKYLNALGCYYLPYQTAMRGEITFNQALDITISSGSKRDYEPHRVTMLIGMYFPEVKSEFNEIMNIRSELNMIVNGYKEQYKRGDVDGSKWLERFQPLFEEFVKKVDRFEKIVTKVNINV